MQNKLELIHMKRWDRDWAIKNPDKLILFGDNILGRGMAGQACVRGLRNAYGIPTKMYPTMEENAFFYDKDFKRNTRQIEIAIDLIPHQVFLSIVLPQDGLGTGLSDMPNKCPKTFEFLNNYLKERLDKICKTRNLES